MLVDNAGESQAGPLEDLPADAFEKIPARMFGPRR